MSIHPTAIIGEEVAISPQATIGPYCVIEGRVEIGAGTVIESHARIGSRFGEVTIGENNYVQCGAVLGGPAQDLRYEGSFARLVIGNGNRIGEYASIHLGSEKGGGVTRLGDRNFIMAFAHIGHDCQLADEVIVTNAAQLAGHVVVGRRALISGLVGITQFVRLGELSFVVGGAFVNKDVPPYTIVAGHWASVRAANRVGLTRAGLDEATVDNIARAVRILSRRSLRVEEALSRIKAECALDQHIERLVDFVTSSDKGIARG